MNLKSLKWKDDFKVPLFFSHGKSNSYDVAIGYCGTEAFKVVNTACDKKGQKQSPRGVL